MNQMRKHIMAKFFRTYNNSVENNLVSTDSVENKSIRDIYNASKLYHRYLSTLKINITETNNIDEANIDNFNECYENAEKIYDEIKKEWFWL